MDIDSQLDESGDGENRSLFFQSVAMTCETLWAYVLIITFKSENHSGWGDLVIIFVVLGGFSGWFCTNFKSKIKNPSISSRLAWFITSVLGFSSIGSYGFEINHDYKFEKKVVLFYEGHLRSLPLLVLGFYIQFWRYDLLEISEKIIVPIGIILSLANFLMNSLISIWSMYKPDLGSSFLKVGIIFAFGTFFFLNTWSRIWNYCYFLALISPRRYRFGTDSDSCLEACKSLTYDHYADCTFIGEVTDAGSCQVCMNLKMLYIEDGDRNFGFNECLQYDSESECENSSCTWLSDYGYCTSYPCSDCALSESGGCHMISFDKEGTPGGTFRKEGNNTGNCSLDYIFLEMHDLDETETNPFFQAYKDQCITIDKQECNTGANLMEKQAECARNLNIQTDPDVVMYPTCEKLLNVESSIVTNICSEGQYVNFKNYTECIAATAIRQCLQYDQENYMSAATCLQEIPFSDNMLEVELPRCQVQYGMCTYHKADDTHHVTDILDVCTEYGANTYQNCGGDLDENLDWPCWCVEDCAEPYEIEDDKHWIFGGTAYFIILGFLIQHSTYLYMTCGVVESRNVFTELKQVFISILFQIATLGSASGFFGNFILSRKLNVPRCAIIIEMLFRSVASWWMMTRLAYNRQWMYGVDYVDDFDSWFKYRYLPWMVPLLISYVFLMVLFIYAPSFFYPWGDQKEGSNKREPQSSTQLTKPHETGGSSIE